MKKCRFITGFASLILTTAIMLSSVAGVTEATDVQRLICEYETAGNSAVVEWSAIERNVLTVSDWTDLDNGVQANETETTTEAPTEAATEAETVVIVESKNSEETSTKKKNKKEKTKKKKTKKKNEHKNTKKAKGNKLKKVGVFKISGYCSCSSCCGKSNGITASGTRARAGRTIAADTSKFPFGTELIINGQKYVVEDRGGAISGNKIDMYFSSHSEALNWGVRYCEVYIAQ